METKFKLLDKVVYEYVNFDKPINIVPISQGCSGAPCYLNNDKVVGIIKRIETTHVEEYYFNNPDDYEQEEEGENNYTYTEYFITGWDKPLTSYMIKYA